MMCCQHFFSSPGIQRVAARAKDHKDNQSGENKQRRPQLKVVADGKKSFRIVYHKHGTDKYGKLHAADNACEQAESNKRPAKNVRKDYIMCKDSACKPQVYTGSGVFQLGHMRNKVEALVCEKQPQNNAKEIKKARTMTIAPPFNVGDNIHDTKRLILTKFTKKTVE